jgi:hypothetical protein
MPNGTYGGVRAVKLINSDLLHNIHGSVYHAAYAFENTLGFLCYLVALSVR